MGRVGLGEEVDRAAEERGLAVAEDGREEVVRERERERLDVEDLLRVEREARRGPQAAVVAEAQELRVERGVGRGDARGAVARERGFQDLSERRLQRGRLGLGQRVGDELGRPRRVAPVARLLGRLRRRRNLTKGTRETRYLEARVEALEVGGGVGPLRVVGRWERAERLLARVAIVK